MPADLQRPRPSRRIATVLVAAALALGAAGCAGEAGSGPTLPSVNFAPKLVIEVDDQIRFEPGPREDPLVTTDPPSVPGGTVIEVANVGATTQRLQGGRGGKVFDTGLLQPGERTTVVLTNDTAADVVVPLTTTEPPDLAAELTVRPRGGTG